MRLSIATCFCSIKIPTIVLQHTSFAVLCSSSMQPACLQAASQAYFVFLQVSQLVLACLLQVNVPVGPSVQDVPEFGVTKVWPPLAVHADQIQLILVLLLALLFLFWYCAGYQWWSTLCCSLQLSTFCAAFVIPCCDTGEKSAIIPLCDCFACLPLLWPASLCWIFCVQSMSRQLKGLWQKLEQLCWQLRSLKPMSCSA